jgi:DNA-binding transcriptional LysR family regulator
MTFADLCILDMLNQIRDPRALLEDSVEVDPGIVDSKRLQMFYISVKEGSFAAAAQILSVSPSAISHAMKALEEDLSCSLFRRLGPQVKPTAAAVRLLPMVQDLLVRMSSMKAELLSLGGRSESLVFRLARPLTGMVPPGVLASFCECFPAADFEMVVADEPQHGLLGRHVDFAIDYLPAVPSEMVRRDLAAEEFHAYVAPFHELGQKSRVSVNDLKSRLLIFSDVAIHDLMTPHLGTGVSGGMRTWLLPEVQTAGQLARQGQGVAFLPQWAVGEAVEEGTLVRLKLPGLELSRSCCVWWEPSQPLTWVAEVFLSLLAAALEPKEIGG